MVRLAGDMKVFFAICFILLNACAHVESRSHPAPHRPEPRRRELNKLFVFGDSFGDVGNRQKSARSLTSRGWYYPYGKSDEAHDNLPTGRYGDGLIEPDYIAKIILGPGKQSPPAYMDQEQDDDVDSTGLNFAVAGSGVLEVPEGEEEVPSLGTQIGQLSRLLRYRVIQKQDLRDSVALIAVSAGRDYRAVEEATSSDDLADLSDRVTDAIVDGVRQLREMGVEKVLVNSLPPFGCAPWQTYVNNYTHCDSVGNTVSSIHNANLKQKLGDDAESVLLLDLDTLFTNLVEPKDGSTLSQRQFKHKYTPCCDNQRENGYCGELDRRGNPLYTLCSNPDKYFFWDYMHPTQEAWKIVMRLLQGQIEEFLGISSW
ncbi:hypothetical protein ACP70R_009028 [Stipagrostis hirtigluma subsp. patula]